MASSDQADHYTQQQREPTVEDSIKSIDDDSEPEYGINWNESDNDSEPAYGIDWNEFERISEAELTASDSDYDNDEDRVTVSSDDDSDSEDNTLSNAHNDADDVAVIDRNTRPHEDDESLEGPTTIDSDKELRVVDDVYLSETTQGTSTTAKETQQKRTRPAYYRLPWAAPKLDRESQRCRRKFQIRKLASKSITAAEFQQRESWDFYSRRPGWMLEPGQTPLSDRMFRGQTGQLTKGYQGQKFDINDIESPSEITTEYLIALICGITEKSASRTHWDDLGPTVFEMMKKSKMTDAFKRALGLIDAAFWFKVCSRFEIVQAFAMLTS